MKSTTNTKGATALLAAAFTYASFGVLIRVMAQMFGNNAQVAFRFVFAFVFLAIFALLVKRPIKLSGKVLMKVAVLGVAFSGVVILFTISVNLTKLGNSVFLLYAGSIVTSLLIGTLVLKEKLTSIKVVAIILSLIGLAMYSSALVALSLGVVTAVLSGVLDGVSNSIRKTLKGIDRMHTVIPICIRCRYHIARTGGSSPRFNSNGELLANCSRTNICRPAGGAW